ncbi:MAG: sensor histidine kinase [Chloroflexota bacterium]
MLEGKVRQQPFTANWKSWLMPRSIDWIGAFLYAAVLGSTIWSIIEYAEEIPNPHSAVFGTTLILSALLFLIVLDRVEFLRYGDYPPRVPLITFLLVRLVTIYVVSLTDGLGMAGSPIPLLVLVLPFVLFYFFGNSNGLAGGVWMIYWMTRDFIILEQEFTSEDRIYVYLMMVMLLLIGSITYLAGQERLSRLKTEQLLSELEASHGQLRQYVAKAEELATVEERNRLAREIHDSLGHYMTVINVQLEKAMVFRQRNSEAADRAVADAKHMAGEALKEIRRSVSSLRNMDSSFSLTESLQQLVEHTGSAQLSVELTIDGDEADFSKQSLLTLYRAAQEGLTNIQKHANASRVQIGLQFDNGQATLRIDDDGCGFDPAMLDNLKPNGHYGLAGIRERLELIQGMMHLASEPGQGTELSICVPKNPLTLVGYDQSASQHFS